MRTYRLLAVTGLLAGLLFTASAQAKKDVKKDQETAKKALAEVGDFVGQWNASGEVAEGKKAIFKETLEIGWKFSKDGDAWMTLTVKDGKFLVSGDLKYLVDKKQYQLTAKDKAGKEVVFLGTLTKGKLLLESKDATSGDVHKLIMNTLADGARMVVQADVQAKGKGLGTTVFKTSATKEGESFAGGGKKNECCVTGGLGTMAVNYNGKTYYVCCSGCRDEFNANPKKIVEDYEKKKGK